MEGPDVADLAHALMRINHWADRCAHDPIRPYKYVLSRALGRWARVTERTGRPAADAVAKQMDKLIAACRREGIDISWVGYGSAVALCGAAHAAALIADPECPDPAWEVIQPALRRRVSGGVDAEGQPQRQRKRQVDGPQRVR